MILKITRYDFHDIISIIDLYLDNNLIEEKPYENVSVYNVVYKNSYAAKPFVKVDEYIRNNDSNKYLALFYSDEK